MMDMKSTNRLLDVRGLTVEIDGRNGPAIVVDGIDLHVDKGETLGVVGESGCGKSLTMLSLMRLLPNKIKVTKGSATFDGRDLQTMSNRELRKVRGGDIGFVFQDPMTSLNPVMRVGDQICEPLIYHRGMKRRRPADVPSSFCALSVFLARKSACRPIRTNFPAACASA